MNLQWDTATGSALQDNTVRLTRFSFPFSGRNWDSMQVFTTGLITFGGGYMLHRRIADTVRGRPEEIAVKVAPVVHPGLRLEQSVNQPVSFVGSPIVNEGLELVGSRHASGEIEIDPAAEFEIVG